MSQIASSSTRGTKGARIALRMMLAAVLALSGLVLAAPAWADETGGSPSLSDVRMSSLAPLESYTIDVSGGDANGPGYTWDTATKVITFTAAATGNTYMLTQTGEQNVLGVVVANDVDTAIILRNLNLETSLSCVKLEGNARLALTLEGENILTSTRNAGIEVTRNAALVIQGEGKLVATGGGDAFNSGAGIGGGRGGTSGIITISGGTVTATGGGNGSGIGGGGSGEGGTIAINGGIVTATGHTGIGGGEDGAGGIITIGGGTVTATGGGSGAGIGGGRNSAGGTITVSGGTVTATGGGGNRYGGSGAGIGGGGGEGGAGGIVTISGGTVTAMGGEGYYYSGNYYGSASAGIGGGEGGAGGTITISGGTVTAMGSGEGAGIGGGRGKTGNPSTSVSIAPDAKVYAFAKELGVPAIDAYDGNAGTGQYVLANLAAASYKRTLAFHVGGGLELGGSFVLPENYASFAYTTGTAVARTDHVFAYQTVDGAYLGRAERIYDSSPDITSTLNAAPTALRLNGDTAYMPPGDGHAPPDDGNLKTPVTQHEGLGRQDTAARASAKAYPDPTQVDNVILAYSYDFPDALAASYLAGVLGAPILLCDTNEVPATTASELSRLNPSAIYIVGGIGVISQGVQDALNTLPGVTSVTRLGGQGREETAYLIANAAKDLGGVPTSAFVAHSGNFPDALSAGSLSAGQGVPILLTPTGALDSWAQRFLDENGVRDIIIVGGTGSVSEAAADQLRALPSAPAVTRWSGPGRYETAEEVLKRAIAKWNITPTVIGLASGEDFPDALVGGAAVGNRGGLLAITEPDALSAAATGIISTYKDSISDVEIFGGTGTIRIKGAVQTLLT